MAVPVALLMIGGEFDLSSGVMVGTLGPAVRRADHRVRHVRCGRPILVTFAFAACIGLINGWLVMLTGLPSFIVTLAMFFSLKGINLGAHQGDHRHGPGGRRRRRRRLRLGPKVFASTFWDPYDY